MVVDTSAVIAIFLDEPEGPRFAAALEAAESPLMSVASVLECAIVLRARKHVPPDDADRRLDAFLASAGIEIEAVTREQLALARAADRRFGRGSGHPAGLHYGDCFSYALAKATGRPLLFKGDDFARTDLRSAL
jgi:ribonuclease VapC